MKLTKGDIALIVFLIVFSLFLAFYMAKINNKVEDKYVSIQVNGKEIQKVDFSKISDGDTYTVETEFGKNVLQFNGKEVKIIEASCLDKLCIKQGNISQIGQILVCLPNRLVVEIKSNTNSTQEIDNFAF